MQEEHEGMRDLVAAYVLGAVTPDEAEMAKAHLVTCLTCQELESTLGETAAYLPALTTELPPPPRLKTRLMAIITAEAQEERASVAPVEQTPAVSPRVVTRRPGQPLGSRTSSLAEWRRRSPYLAPLAALAAVLVLAIIGIGLSHLLRGTPVGPTTVYAMAGTSVQPTVKGALRYAGDTHQVEIDLHHLKALTAPQVYELWLIRGHYRVMHGVGTFRPDRTGTVQIQLSSDNLASYTLACITVESTMHAQRPTLPLVAIAPIA